MHRTPQQAARSHDYLRRLAHSGVGKGFKSVATAELELEPGHVVADLGCGTGTLSLLLADEGHRVDGVDFSPAMVARSLAKAEERRDVRFVVGDAAAPPLDRGAYDVVLCRHVLWALPDPAAALRRWVDLLAPRWTAEGIRLFALLMLVVGAVAFLAGLLVPALRCGSTAC